MKRGFFSIWTVVVCIAFFPSCSIDEDWASSKKTNFPDHIEEYGIALAKEFRQTVNNLNEMGILYSEADASPDLKERFFNDWYAASPTATRSEISMQEMDLYADPAAFAVGYRNLTEVQKRFISRIISESESSHSINEFLNRLLSINEDIYDQVPKIEQERLLLVSSTLYYLVGEIENLKKSGQMFAGTFTNMPLVKTRSEEGGGFWGECKEFFSAVAIAVGTVLESPAGKTVVKSVVRVASGAGYIILGCLLLTGDTDDYRQRCTDKYVQCVTQGRLPHWQCDDCRVYCMGQRGEWDCPRPY